MNLSLTHHLHVFGAAAYAAPDQFSADDVYPLLLCGLPVLDAYGAQDSTQRPLSAAELDSMTRNHGFTNTEFTNTGMPAQDDDGQYTPSHGPQVYEVTLPGYEADHLSTGDALLWVVTDATATLLSCVAGLTGVTLTPLDLSPSTLPASVIDYTLPAQADQLATHVRWWCSEEWCGEEVLP